MDNMLMLTAFILALASPAAGAADPRGVSLGAFAEPLGSLSACGDGIAILARDGRLLLVDGQGGRSWISLPPVDGGPADFGTLAVRDRVAWLCRAKGAVLYRLDLDAPARGYAPLPLKGLPPGSAVDDVAVTERGIFATASTGTVYAVDGKGAVTPAPRGTVPVPGPGGASVRLTPPDPMGDDTTWTIDWKGGKPIARDRVDNFAVRSLRPLGIDGHGRLVAVERTGDGAGWRTGWIRAFTGGGIPASAPFEPGTGHAIYARDAALLADGSVALLRSRDDGRTEILLISLP